MIYVSHNVIENLETFSTITDALDKAKECDEILIYPGTYKENICIKKQVKLVGKTNNPEQVIIENIDDRDASTVYINEDCKISNLTIKNDNYVSLYIYGCHDVFINNCNIVSQNNLSCNIKGAGLFRFKNCI